MPPRQDRHGSCGGTPRHKWEVEKLAPGRTRITDFTRGSIPRALAVFSWPLILANLLQVLYNMVDMMVVGRVLGKTGLAAVSVGGDVTHFLTFLIMGFSSAGQVIISHYVGRGEKQKIGPFVATMSSFVLLSALVISLLGFLFRRRILALMNTPPDALEGALSYTMVCMAGLVFIFGYNAVSAILRGMGDSIHPLLFIAAAAVLNFLLDVLLVAEWDMGPAGAAWATVISQGVSFLSCLVFLICRRKEYELNIGWREFVFWDLPMLAELVSIGVPMAVKSAAVQASRLYVSAWVNSYGTAVSAFSGIAGKVSNTAIIISNSMSTAGASMVGQNLAAGKDRRVKQILKWVAVITISFAGLLSALMILFPRQIFGVFTAGGEPAVLALSGAYVPIAVLMFFGSGLRAVMNGFINGSGNHFVISVTAVMDGIVMRLGLAVLFGLVLDMKYVGFWLGDALAGFTPFWIGIIFYIKYFSGRQWADGGDEEA